VLTGAAVGYRPDAERFYPVFAAAMLTVLLLQILSNYANDLGDAENGADGAERVDRAVASGRISRGAMRRAVIALAALALVSGVGTVVLALQGTGLLGAALALIAAGLAGIYAAYSYTAGKNPYGYRGLGDLMVMVFFGWVGVSGTAFLVSGAWSWAWLLPGTFTGAMSVAVLNLNNMRDHERDAAAGKRTLVTRMGFARAKRYHWALLGLGWAALLAFTNGVESGQWRGMMWIALLGLVHFQHALRVRQTTSPEALDPELKKIALSTAVVALFLFLAATRNPMLP
jgi:1,4-dihydroxy-2-naphthoate octaprenyltransferase